MDTLVVNLFGGPGTGKSTAAALLFAELKFRNVNCEMALEYAKDKVWEESYRTLENQIYVFGHQHYRIWKLLGKVDVVITDSPLLLSLYYAKNESPLFHQLVVDEHKKLRSLNVFLVREKQYQPAGRMQTETQAREIDGILKGLLKDNGIEHITLRSEANTIKALAGSIIEMITEPPPESLPGCGC